MTRPVDPVFAAAVRAELASRRATLRSAQAAPGAWRSVLVAVVVAAVVVPSSILAIVLGTARPAETGIAARVQRAGPCDAAPTAPFDCHMYIAVGASEGGVDAGWLAAQPLRASFSVLNGRLTFGIDDHVNGASTPVSLHGDQIWTGKDGASTTAGCFRPAACSDERFVDGLLSHPATYAFSGTELVITSGSRVLRLAPTAAAPDAHACRDQIASDPLPCPALVSVTGYDHGQRLDWLRADPLRATITRRGTGYELELGGDTATATVPIRSTAEGLISKAGSATVIVEAMLTPGDHSRDLFLADFFQHDVHCTMRFSTLTLDDGDRTIQLEAVAP